MPKLQIFFDYECPFCKKGYEYFMEMIDDYPDIDVCWIPVEAHPKPEEHTPHTDKLIEAFYLASDLGLVSDKFHRAMYQAVAIERRNVENEDVLAEVLSGFVDKQTLLSAISSGKYAGRAGQNNRLAYEDSGVWFVPAFRADGKKLDAKGGFGVTKEQISKLLSSLS